MLQINAKQQLNQLTIRTRTIQAYNEKFVWSSNTSYCTEEIKCGPKLWSIVDAENYYGINNAEHSTTFMELFNVTNSACTAANQWHSLIIFSYVRYQKLTSCTTVGATIPWTTYGAYCAYSHNIYSLHILSSHPYSCHTCFSAFCCGTFAHKHSLSLTIGYMLLIM